MGTASIHSFELGCCTRNDFFSVWEGAAEGPTDLESAAGESCKGTCHQPWASSDLEEVLKRRHTIKNVWLDIIMQQPQESHCSFPSTASIGQCADWHATRTVPLLN